MPVEMFEKAVKSLGTYFGLIALFGGQPTLHPEFPAICEVMTRLVPRNKRGLWTNALNGHGKLCREVFDPVNCNLNVHLDQAAYDEFKRDWPECNPVGLHQDSRHAPVFLAMRDVLKKECHYCEGTGTYKIRPHITGGEERRVPCVGCSATGKAYDVEKGYELISQCDINQHWSAMIGMFRDQLRAWFCEVAGAQNMLRQDDESEPDTGLDPTVLHGQWGKEWWQLGMDHFAGQVKFHCHRCGVPLKGRGELSQAADGVEQTSQHYASVYKPKRRGRKVELVTVPSQLGAPLERMTDYLGNAKK
jgi:hypothetical protein